MGRGRQDPISLSLPALAGPVWPEAEPTSSRSSPRWSVFPPWRGGTTPSVPSPTLPPPPPPAAGVPGPEAPRPSWAPTQARNKAQCVIPVRQSCHLPGPALCLSRPSVALPGPSPAPLFGPPLVAGPLSMRVPSWPRPELNCSHAGGGDLGPLSSPLS